MARRRLAGTRWRFLAWEAPRGRGGMCGERIALESDDSRPSVFDELVVDSWFHMEQMDSNLWWISIAGVVVFVRPDRDGRPKEVTVWGPGDYNLPVEGVTYAGIVGPE